MGTIKHDTLVVTSFRENDINKAHTKIKELLIEKFKENEFIKADSIVSEVLKGLANDQFSFFVAPDGSKEGWTTSTNVDEVRETFIEWLDGDNGYFDYVQVRFGGDWESADVTSHNKE